MFEFITTLFVIAIVAYVAMPLIKPQHPQKNNASEKDRRVIELEYQQNMLRNVIDDLRFDYDTGKLSEEDYQSLAAEHQKSIADLKARMNSIRGGESTKQKQNLKRDKAQGRRNGNPKTPLTCSTCNSVVGENDRFCASCGAALK